MTLTAQSCPSSLMKALRDLDIGILNHTSWLKVLHRSLICDAPSDPRDLLPDAHLHCFFGQWYYEKPHQELQDGHWFGNIGRFHQEMHELARSLLDNKARCQRVGIDEYEQFMDMAIRFKLEVRALQAEIINKVCEVDHLTGARNRNSMNLKLLEEHDRMLRNGHTCCVCMMDVDHFKRVNDEFGHLAGDSVLQAIVQFFGKKLRKYDSIFRFGGEEFLFCLPNTNLEEAFAVMDRLRAELGEFPIGINRVDDIHITASFGVAVMHRDETIEDVVGKADHALLCAKAGGRNRVCLWNV